MLNLDNRNESTLARVMGKHKLIVFGFFDISLVMTLFVPQFLYNKTKILIVQELDLTKLLYNIVKSSSP